MGDVKIAFIDCETTPLISYHWGTFDQTINPNNIINDRQILCIAWKILGEKSVRGVRVGADKTERQMIAEFRAAMEDVNVLVAHNLPFDYRHINAKLIEHDLPPLPKQNFIDTLKAVKRVAKFSSNRLDFLCGKLLGRRKIETDMDLWKDSMAGDEKALSRMLRYCKNDVELLEALYLRLRPYMFSHPNVAAVDTTQCPRCASDGYTVNKTYRTLTGIERVHVRCVACATPYTLGARRSPRPISAG